MRRMTRDEYLRLKKSELIEELFLLLGLGIRQENVSESYSEVFLDGYFSKKIASGGNRGRYVTFPEWF